MLTAGVFGTVMGDICEHAIGEGVASIVLTALLLAVLLAGRGRAAQIIALYWTTVAVARTAGTALSDWLAENKILHIACLWRSGTKEARHLVESAVSRI